MRPSLPHRSTRFAILPLMAVAALFFVGLTTPVLRAVSESGIARSNPVTQIEINTALRDARLLASGRADLDVVRVEGRSMLPFFGDGAVLVVKTTVPAASLRPGMLVLYTNHLGERIAHRVEKATIEGDWIVRGWNNADRDSTRVTDHNLIGVVYATFHADPQTLLGAVEPALAATPVAFAAPAK